MSGAASELVNEIVRAGAGAGKTTRLTRTVLETAQLFLARDGRLPRIVVTTFTRKATQELRERLVAKACESGEQRLVDFVSSHGDLHISTIHGVLSSFLRRYGHLIELDPGFTFLESMVANRLARKVMREEVLRDSRYQELLEAYSFDELVMMAREFAEASSGVEWLRPYSMAEITDRAAQERRSVAQDLMKVAHGIVAEANAPAWSDYGQHLGRCADLLVNENFDGVLFLETLGGVSKPRYVVKSAPISEPLHDELKALLKRCEEMAGAAHSREEIAEWARLSELFGALAREFTLQLTAAKHSQGLLEMGDLESLAEKAVREHPAIAAAFAAEWDYWLIDEYQDTSPRQVELLKSLVGGKPVFIVGDPQQSIYLFRGARSEVFRQQEDEFARRGYRASELAVNYRSCPELLLFLNDFFAQFNSGFMVMQPRAPALNPDKRVAQFTSFASEAEAPYLSLAADIRRAVANGERYEDFCVLARTNAELRPIARYFEQSGIATHIHASDGFFRRREVLDALTLLKFFMNPLDNVNLIRLVRAPWFRVSDAEIMRCLEPRPAHYWEAFNKELPTHPTIIKLGEILRDVEKLGYVESLRSTLVECGLLDQSHFHDPTGRRESNVWKLISLLKKNERSPGFNLMSFVKKCFQGYRSTEGDEESDAVAALEPNCVNFMTIHKAKGLKFRHVVVPNMHKKLTASESRGHKELFVSANGRFTLAIRVGEERKITHNLLAEDYFAEVSNREREEYWRVLYVAMTRAEESVTLHYQESPPSGSWAGDWKWSLAEGVHSVKSQTLPALGGYSFGVAASESELASLSMEPQNVGAVRPLWIEAATFAEAAVERRVSVTRLLEEKVSPAGAIVESSRPPSNSRDLLRQVELPVLGQKLHMILERMKSSKNLDMKKYGEKWFGARAPEFQRAIDFVLNLKQPPIRELIAAGEVEWGFQLRTARGVMEGQIDLWGVDSNDVTWVIDYKSGSSRFSDKAFAQLSLYAHALREYGVSGEIRLAVVYAIEEKCEIRLAPLSADISREFEI